MVGANVAADGRSIEMSTRVAGAPPKTTIVTVPTRVGRPNGTPPTEGRESLNIENVRVRNVERSLSANIQIGRFVYRANSLSIEKTFLYSEEGLFVLDTANSVTAVPIPLMKPKDRIEDVVELPASKAAFIVSSTNVFVLDDMGSLAEVPGGRDVGSYRVDHIRGIIPISNEIIIAGPHSLYFGHRPSTLGQDSVQLGIQMPSSRTCPPMANLGSPSFLH